MSTLLTEGQLDTLCINTIRKGQLDPTGAGSRTSAEQVSAWAA
jgi:hypothetical protein